jgi:uncharacterized membrane protein
METKNTSTGLPQNIVALLSYVVGWITGIIFLLLEPDNKFVRFHAIQSIIVFGFITVLSAIWGYFLGWVPILGILINIAIWGLTFALWIVLMFKAYQGDRYKLPVSGELAEKWSEKQSDPPHPPAP